MIQPNLEVIIPARNPNKNFLQSILSLSSQECKAFIVTISDNFSTSGIEYFEEGQFLLEKAGISCRRVQPKRELGRIEHWNWAIHQTNCSWVKPIFAGDSLLPGAMQKFHDATIEHSDIPFFFSPYIFCGEGKEAYPVSIPWVGRNTAEKMREVVLKYGMQFGPPSGVVFRKQLFIASGGFAPGLPITADSLLFCRLAAFSGAFCFPEPMFRFTIHASRFSKGLPQKRKETFWETLNYRTSLLYYAWTQGWALHFFHYARGMLRAISA